MVFKINKINWLNRVKDDFDGETVTVKLMKGNVPTLSEVYDMTPTTRDTDMLASFNVVLDGAGVSKNEVTYTPSASGDVTWMKIIFGNYVITTDRVGLINDASSMIWLPSKTLVSGTAQTMYLLYIKINEVTA
jgi:hypothetical protein